jgi:hypothetical protein
MPAAPRVRGFEVRGFEGEDSRIQDSGFKDSRIQGFKDSRIQGCEDEYHPATPATGSNPRTLEPSIL